VTLKRLLVVVFVIVFPLILIWLYLPGWTRYNELRKEDERLRKELDDMRKTSRQLEDEEHLLKHDVRYLEQVLREELNVIRPDETVYKLVPEESPAPSPQGDKQSVEAGNKA